MGKASDNVFPKVILSTQSSSPSAPGDSTWKMYAKANGVYARSSNTEVGPFGTGSGGSSFVGCLATRTTDQGSVTNDTNITVTFNGPDAFDTHGFHDPASNASRITIPSGRDGYYIFSAFVIWDGGSSSGFRRIGFLKNGSNATGLMASSIDGRLTDYEMQRITSDPISLAAGDYVEVFVRQNSGGTRTLSGSILTLSFSCTFVGS